LLVSVLLLSLRHNNCELSVFRWHLLLCFVGPLARW